MRNKIIVAAICIFLLLAGVLIGRSLIPVGKESVVADTLWRTRIVVSSHPKAKDSVVVRYTTVGKSRPEKSGLRQSPGTEGLTEDSTRNVSALVPESDFEVPIVQKVYEDSTYTAWVSGYECNLDSIHLKIRNPTITREYYRTDHDITSPYGSQSARRFSFGFQGGFGITPKGLQPYLGFGIGFRLL